MNYIEARDLLRPKIKDYIERVTRKSEKGDYICPFCDSGTGENKTGALSIDPKDNVHWKCFSCEKRGDIFDFIGKLENIPSNLERLKRVAEIYGIDISSYKKSYRGENMNAKKKDDFRSYFKECHARIDDISYHTDRGISNEVANRFMLGYDINYRIGGNNTPWKALIIPTSAYSYVARNTDLSAEDRYRKRGSSVPLNIAALQTAKKPIFIVEGELDALSIIEVGGEAIGLGSASNIRIFINNYLEKHKPVQPLILALDKDERGKKATEELSSELEKLGVSFYRLDPYGEAKDANAALINNREDFARAISQAEHIEDEAIDIEKKEYLKTSSYSCLESFINGISESVNTPVQSTGFKNLDLSLDGGLYEGLYIIGAITSLGKTTMLLQIADQIAKSGRDVLIFSLEMSKNELISKSISRLTVLNVLENPLHKWSITDAKTNRDITVYSRYEKYSKEEIELIDESVMAYGKYADHIYIKEGIGDIGVKQIKDAVNKHKLFTGQSPVVVVDYIQILSPYDVRATDKQNTDKSVLELKRISRDCRIPIIGISSFNRANYKEEVTLEAFKESGSLEYGSDVLIGLQMKGAGNKNFNVLEAKRKNPREIELVILKNRNGETGNKVYFNYYSKFNYFKEISG